MKDLQHSCVSAVLSDRNIVFASNRDWHDHREYLNLYIWDTVIDKIQRLTSGPTIEFSGDL